MCSTEQGWGGTDTRQGGRRGSDRWAGDLGGRVIEGREGQLRIEPVQISFGKRWGLVVLVRSTGCGVRPPPNQPPPTPTSPTSPCGGPLCSCRSDQQ